MTVEITDLLDFPIATTAIAFSTTTVADSPLSGTGPVDFAGTEGTALIGQYLATFSHLDGDHSPSGYQVTVNWGDGSSPDTSATLSITPGAPGTPDLIDVTGSHTYALKGTYNVSITLLDEGGSQATVTTQAIIGEATLSDTLSPLGYVTTAGSPLTNILVGAFQDSNPLAKASDFAVIVDWGDGTTTAGTVVPYGLGLFAVEGSHTYTSPSGSPYTVTTTITDLGVGGSIPEVPLETPAELVETQEIQVNAAAIVPTAYPLSVVEGGSIPAGTLVGTFTDLSGAHPAIGYQNIGTFVNFPGATGNTPLTVTQNGSTNTYTLTTSAATNFVSPIEEGVLTYTLQVTDATSTIGATVGTLTVTDAPLSLVSTNPMTPPPVEGQLLTNIGLLVFNDSNAFAPLSDFVATIDWGDGSPQTIGSLSYVSAPGPGGVQILVSGSHTYADATATGVTYQIKILVTDKGGQTLAAATAPFVVTDAPLSTPSPINVIGAEGQFLNNVPLGTFVDANPLATPADFTASIAWGNGNTSLGTITRVGTSPAGAIFLVSGSNIYTAATGSPFSITVTVTDEDNPGNTVTISPTATITQTPLIVSVLSISSASGTTVPAGTPVALFFDLNSPNLPSGYNATIYWGDGTTSTGAITLVSGNQFQVTNSTAHTYLTPGLFPVTVVVNDPDPTSGVGNGFALVSAAAIIGQAPEGLILPVPPIAFAVEGHPIFGTGGGPIVSFSDADLGLSATDFRATIDWGDGSPQSAGVIIPGLLPGTYLVLGNHTYLEESLSPQLVTVYVSDPYNNTVTITNIVTVVLDAALIPGPGVPIFATEHQPLNDITIGTFTDTNPFATVSDFTNIIIHWGDGTPDTPGFVKLVSGSPAGAVFAVYGSHVYTKTSPVGAPYQTSFSLQDIGGAPALINVPGGLATISQAPISVDVLPLTIGVGQTVSSQVIATFTDAAGSAPLASYTPIIIEWGDGATTTLTGAQALAALTDLGGGHYSITAPLNAHTYTTVGVYTLKVTVVDSDPATGIGAALVIVSPAQLTLTVVPEEPIAATEGLPLVNVPLATITDSNPGAVATDFLAMIDWGDGSPQSVGTVTPGIIPGTFLVSGNHTYLEEAVSHTITVIVTDNTGGTATATLSATVADAPLVNPTPIPISVTVGQQIMNAPLGLFSDTNPFATASDFTATINWGDSSPVSPGFVTLVGGTSTSALFSVSGSHLYTSAVGSPYTVTINVVDKGGQSVTITTTVTVTASQISLTVNPVVATEGIATPANLPIGTFYDPGAGPATTYFVTLFWGDGGTNTSAPGGGLTIVNDGGGNYTVLAPPHIYMEEGAYVLTLTVTGSDGAGPISATNIALVKDAALTATNGGPFIVSEGEPLVATNLTPLASFVDANPFAPISDFTVTVDWGDGTTSVGTVTQPGGIGTVFNVLGSHTYAKDGAYTIHISIVDEGGSKANATAAVTVTQATFTAGPQLNIQAYDNNPLTNVEVATFTSSNPLSTASNFVATIDWGDGSPVTAGWVSQDASGVFHVKGSHTYSVTGTYFVHVTIAEGDPVIVLDIPNAAVVTVSDVALIVLPVPILGIEGIALPNAQNVPNGTVVATFLDLGQAGALSEYTASIDWGNGLVTPGTIAADGPNFVVLAPSSPLIRYDDAGTYSVRVTITHRQSVGSGFYTAYAFSTATIKDAPLTADPIQPIVNAYQQTPLLAVNVAKFTDGNPFAPLSDFTATIDWGDGSPQSAGQFIQPGGVGTAFYVTGNHTYANPTNPPAVPYTITVYIKDEDGSKLTTTTQALVQSSTIVGTPVTINGVEGLPLISTVVGYFTDSGIPGPLSSYSASINWGDGSPASVGQIVPLGGNYFQVLGTHTYLEENVSPGVPYAVTVSITHNGQLSSVFVSQANIADAPISGVALPIFTTEGAEFKGQVGYFTDMNPYGTVSDFTATINWGDGTSSAGKVLASGSGFIVMATDPISGVGHIYKKFGAYTYSITVQDIGGSTFTAYQTATVNNAPLTSTGVTLGVSPLIYEWPAFTGTVAYFTDANPYGQAPPIATPGDYVATIFWGDGITSTGTITQIATAPGAPTQFMVSGTHLYEEGNYQITIQIRDDGGGMTTAISTIIVTDSPLTPLAPLSITSVEGKSVTAQVARFTDADLRATISDFVATINWGDGTTSAGIIGQLADGTFTVTGTHTYIDESPVGSPYQVLVSIKDLGGSTTSVTSTATVTDAPLTSQGAFIQGIEGISIGSGKPSGTVLIATFFDTNPFSTIVDFTTDGGSVTIDWGDGSALYPVPPANITSVGSPSGVTYQIFATHTYAETGSYQIITTIRDSGGAATVAHGEADIADAPLSSAPNQPAVNTTEEVVFSGPVYAFVDANPQAPLGDFTATIDWGDGSPRSTGTITQPDGVGTTFYVNGIHTYDDSHVNGGTGKFTIVVNIYDEDGAKLLDVTNTANVADVPIALFGRLDPVTDSGPSNIDAITKINQPIFYGTSEPFSSVYVYANMVPVGVTQADGSGAWKLQTNLLVDGTYVVTAKAVDQYGYTTGTTQILPNPYQGSLVIDTVAPKVTNVVFGSLAGQIYATFQDNLSGLDHYTLVDASNYSFHKRNQPPGGLLVTALPTTAWSPTSPITVSIQINQGRALRGGYYTLIIRSGGIQDMAGNPLDGEYYGYFPSGNNRPGGDFIAELNSIHHTVYAPRTVIGPASPVNPRGSRPNGYWIPRIRWFNQQGAQIFNAKYSIVNSGRQVPNPLAVQKASVIGNAFKR